LYLLQEVIGFLFGMSQGRANEWIGRLSNVLQRALELAFVPPERKPECAGEALTSSIIRNFTRDGTERRIQRPVDKEKQSAEKRKPIP